MIRTSVRSRHWNITMTSWWGRWRLKSPASPLFTQPFIKAQIKENIKAPRHWPLWGEFTGGGQWIPRTNGQLRGKCFHLMTSLCVGSVSMSWHRAVYPTHKIGCVALFVIMFYGRLCGKFTGPRWIPHTEASDEELWCFLWSASD